MGSHSSSIPNSQEGGSNPNGHQQMKDKQNVVHSHYGVLLGHKGNEIQIYATMWLYLKTLLSERSQTQRATYDLSVWDVRSAETEEGHQRLCRARGGGVNGEGGDCWRLQGFFLQMTTMF